MIINRGTIFPWQIWPNSAAQLHDNPQHCYNCQDRGVTILYTTSEVSDSGKLFVHINIIHTHHVIIITQVNLQRLNFIALKMVKLKRSQKNLKLDVNAAKNPEILCCSVASSKFPSNGKSNGELCSVAWNLHAAEYHWLRSSTPNPVHLSTKLETGVLNNYERITDR